MADKTFDLTKIGLPVGTHGIQMRLSDDGVTKRDSALSNAVTYVQYQQLTAPVISLSGDILSWSAVPNASSYRLYADNVSKGTVTSGIDLTTLSLSVGTHTIQVMAVGSGYYTDSDKSNSVSYTVQPSGGYDFANDSWETIFTQIKAGTDHYNLGDTKTDTFNFGSTSYQCTWKIVDDTVGRYVTQSGQSHKVIEMQELVGLSDGSGVAWNGSSLLTSFANSDLFANLNSTILGYLSADLKAQLETTTVYSGNGSATASAGTNVPATGKLFVPCVTELYGDTTYGYANNSEGTPQYTYYAQQGVSKSSYDDLIKYNIEDSTSTGWYWTRSPYGPFGPRVGACGVRSDGSLDYGSVGRDINRVAPCFAI